MNHSLKSKLTKVIGKPVSNAKKLIKVFDKDSKTYIYKSTDVIINISSDSLKVYCLKKTKEVLICKFCLKHVFISRATDNTVPRIDSCRVLSDPFSKQTLLSFPNPSIANDYEIRINKERDFYNTVYANISYFVNVTNKINETIKDSASVCVSGLTTGKELKIWIEKEFNFSEIYMPKYIVQIELGNIIQTIKDDIPLLVLYEHLCSKGTSHLCSQSCYNHSKAPPTNLILHINLNISEKKSNEMCNRDSYSIEDKWGADMMPNWLIRLLSDLYYYGPKYEGVFRLSGRDSCLAKWYKHMLAFDDFLITEDIYNKAAIFKYFIRRIKGSLMTQGNKREFNKMCKKFIKMSAEKYLECDKKKKKLIRMIENLPKTHLFLLQNILVVIEALINSEKTLLKPFSISRSISPSIFPLMHLSHWKHATKLFEAIILLTDELVDNSVRRIILKNFTHFHQNDSVANATINVPVDQISCQSSSTSMMSFEETDNTNSKVHSDLQTFESESELDSSDTQQSDYDLSCDDDILSSDDEQPISSISEILPEEVSSRHLVSEIIDTEGSKNDTDIDLVSQCEDEINNSASNVVNPVKPCKNICMGIKMKEIYHISNKSIELDSSTDLDNSKENGDKITVALRHKSLLKAGNSSCKELNRSSSAIVASPRIARIINEDCVELRSSEGFVIRKNSRKALSAFEELNNNFETTHRSRSPNVKSLIKMYEERNKIIISDDIGTVSDKFSRPNSEFNAQ